MNYNKKELLELKNIILKMRIDGITKITQHNLKEYLTEKQYNLLRKIMSDPNFNDYWKEEENKLIIKEAKRIMYETPYTILNIDESNYTKEQLLDIVKKRIMKINAQSLSNKDKQQKQDEVLDAYNSIVKSKNMK